VDHGCQFESSQVSVIVVVDRRREVRVIEDMKEVVNSGRVETTTSSVVDSSINPVSVVPIERRVVDADDKRFDEDNEEREETDGEDPLEDELAKVVVDAVV
jgi:hypothetical protein